MPHCFSAEDDLPDLIGPIRRPDNAYGDGVEWHTGLPFKLIWALTAAAAGDVAEIRKLGSDHPELIPACHRDAMPFAVRAGHVAVVQAMIDFGAFEIGRVELQQINALIDIADTRSLGAVSELMPVSLLNHTDIKRPADAFHTGDEIPLSVIECNTESRRIVLSVKSFFGDRDHYEIEQYISQHPVVSDRISEMGGLDAGTKAATDVTE